MSDDCRDEDRAAILARRQRFIALALGGLATGCVPPETASDDGTTTVASSTTESTTTGTTVASSTTRESETETGFDTGTTSSIFVPPSPRPCLSACDTFAQDCPEGEKCVPYGSTGGTWDATKCVLVAGDNPVGEACIYDGTTPATDDCDESTYCWNAQDVEGTLIGVCTSFCAGSPDNWICADGTVCLISNEGSVTLCVDECDPLMQDCDADFACSWTGDTFGCLLTSAALPAGDACAFVNECAPGTLCIAAEASLMCEGSTCCVDLCGVDDPESCPDPQLECASFFAEDQAPVGLEMVGVCVPPGACDDEDPGCLEHLP